MFASEVEKIVHQDKFLRFWDLKVSEFYQLLYLRYTVYAVVFIFIFTYVSSVTE